MVPLAKVMSLVPETTAKTSQKPVALVTGGAQRLGKQMVIDLAAGGFSVAVHYNSSAKQASNLCEKIISHGGNAIPVQADLSKIATLPTLIDEVQQVLGPVQLLVNNASLFEEDDATSPDWALWDQHFDIHVKAPVALASRMYEKLPDDMNGLVINVIDQRVWRLTPKFFSYTLSKSALWTATQTMAMSFAPKMRVNAIAPGPTLKNERQNDSDFQAQIDALLLKKGPDLSEFGATIFYLWNARSITGQMIALDGGQHLAWQTPDIYGIKE